MKKWWQFWKPSCPCINKELIDTDVETNMPVGDSMFTAVGDWRWYEYKCLDCGKHSRDGHWE